eukprot:TRINITY_DN44390_c0_g1_i1.p2 TRINITY_DN44390_c0_g1~~TRINITY_DN44390_c0_g1_i1.p2  ORF type:complete len:207 (-),score=19.54 TRINITY_DN44390_c0_g1_i1:272-892(-)
MRQQYKHSTYVSNKPNEPTAAIVYCAAQSNLPRKISNYAFQCNNLFHNPPKELETQQQQYGIVSQRTDAHNADDVGDQVSSSLGGLWKRLLHWKAQLEILRGRFDQAAQYTIAAVGSFGLLETYVECLYYYLMNYTLKDSNGHMSFKAKCERLIGHFAKDVKSRGVQYSPRTLEALGRIAKLANSGSVLCDVFFEQKLMQELGVCD